MNLTEKIWPAMTCPNGHRASMAGCHTQDCPYTILAPKSVKELLPPPVAGKPPGQLTLKIVATQEDGRLVGWDEHGEVWLLENRGSLTKQEKAGCTGA